MVKNTDCIFCGIISGEMPARVIYEDSVCVAIEDAYPKAPVHLLVMPCAHVATLLEAEEKDEALLGHLLQVGARLAKQKGLKGFRMVINTNAEAGQTIFHLHLHVMGGRIMRWPPG